MPPPSKLEALVGQVIDGHYRLDALLGAGGMGAVYRAHHTSLDRDVAIKILHPDIGADPSISKRFDREAQSASRLDHQNCVRVTDFGTDAGIKYLVMELLEGEELGARLGQPWEPERACEVLEQILAGLDHAHLQGIVHRDLKPENIYMTRDFRGQELAKIVDFGIAKLLDADGAMEVLTRAGMVFGTPRYMSPEQATGGKVDERSDLYAVGVLAHELLSGAPPFDSEDLAAILRMQIIAPPPPLPDRVPAPLAAWVERMLEKSRHERPESAAVARAQLVAIRKAMRERSATETGADGQTAPPVDMLAATGEHMAAAIPSPIPSPIDDGPSAALPSKPEHMIGQLVADRFELLELLGAGGMGAVFRAQDSRTGAAVAIKLLHAALADDDELAARFEREAQTASELEHPNIVPVFSHGTTPGAGAPARYLVMPLLEGVELRELIRAGPMDPPRAAALMLQLFDALAHAHAHAVVHRDLKPENVFVIHDEAGLEQIQLVDFGLAKVAEAGTRRALTQFGQVFGTPAYMSPEQCRGEVVDARADLYAAGVIFHELLAGQAPFVASEPVVLIGMQLNAEPPPLPDHVPPALRELVADLLIKDRDRRVASASVAIAALRAADEAPGGLAAARAPINTGATMRSIDASTPVPPALAPAQPAWRRIPRAWLYAAGAGLLVLSIVLALLPSGDGGSGGGSWDTGGWSSGPDKSVYLEIDKLLSAKDTDTALDAIRKARDDHPKDGGLMWREGRALAIAGGRTNQLTALHRYAEAVSANPSLGDETEFEAELRTLLRDRKLRETAIDVAVRELGPLGHSFLLEVMNEEDTELGYVDRHRILDELRNDPDTLARVDLRRHVALDLDQAAYAPAPCAAFAEALDAIADSQDPYYLELLYKRSLEVPDTPGLEGDASDCEALEAELDETREALAAEHPEAAAKAKRSGSKGGGKKKSGGGFKLPF